MQQPRRITFDEFARRLRAVFDAVQREKKPVLVEREGQLFRVERESLREAADIWFWRRKCDRPMSVVAA